MFQTLSMDEKTELIIMCRVAKLFDPKMKKLVTCFGAAAILESSGGLDLEGRAPPSRNLERLRAAGREGVGLATFSRTELLEHRCTAVRE